MRHKNVRIISTPESEFTKINELILQKITLNKNYIIAISYA